MISRILKPGHVVKNISVICHTTIKGKTRENIKVNNVTKQGMTRKVLT